MLAKPLTSDEQPQGLATIQNAGQIVEAPPMPIPIEPKQLASTGNYAVPRTGIVAAMNNFDPDDDSEFDTFILQDSDLLDESAFLGINFKKIGQSLGKAGRFVFGNLGKAGGFYLNHFTPYGTIRGLIDSDENNRFTGHNDFSNYMGTDIEAVAPNFAAILKKAAESGMLHVPTRILTNQVYHLHLSETQPSSYTGSDYSHFDGISLEDLQQHQAFFDGLSPYEQEVYSDFLGINFKKIGKAIGGAIKGVGKAVGAVGKGIGKVAGAVGKGVGKAAIFTGKTIGKGAKLLGKGVLAGVKLGAKVLSSQSGLDSQTEASNGVILPPNWGAGPAAGGYNEEWNPELGEDREYDPALGDQNLYDMADIRDAESDEALRAAAARAVAGALEPEPVFLGMQKRTVIWIAVLAAVLGIGFYLVKTHKIKF